jgi:hypothetical protein
MLAKATGVGLRSVQRILETHQLAPHRIRIFKLSTDPKFAEKLKAIAGLSVDPPAHAVVLSVEESQIQALDRTQPGLPMKPGRAGTMTHDYKRHGTTKLFAALHILDGTVIGRNRQRHCHQEFIRFLNTIEEQVPVGKVIHAIVDNYAHTQASKGAPMAGAASPLDIPLHSDISVLAKRGRRLLRQTHTQTPQARRVPICR